MLLTIRMIAVYAFFAPFASSFTTHRLLEIGDCEKCTELNPFQYANDNCCDMGNIGDICFDIIHCLDGNCEQTAEVVQEAVGIEHQAQAVTNERHKATKNEHEVLRNMKVVDDNQPDDAICRDFDCGLCLDFAEKVTDECCPFFNSTSSELNEDDPDIEMCLNTLAAFQFSCLRRECLNEEDLPWVQNENPCESGPTISPRPTMFPTLSPAPTSSAAPTLDCTCCDCTHSSGCNPDPHYYTWNNEFYDFQGGCDQIAIDNPILQLQIRTRPRGGYSTITEVGLLLKAYSEVFHMNTAEPAAFNLTNGASVTPLTSYNGYNIVFHEDPDSFIRVTNYAGNIAVQVSGKGYTFSDSEGMFGSWNYGGVRFRNGTIFDTSGGWTSTRERSSELALDWMVQLGESLFTVPSIHCDGSRNCGDEETFPCDATRRLQDQTCEKSCNEIPNEIARSACEEDKLILNGNNAFTCQPAYIEPLIVEADSCDFEKLDDDTCMAKGTTCKAMDGFCQEDCIESETHVCLPGLCSEKKISKSNKGIGTKGGNKYGHFNENKGKAGCMCYAPKRCAV